MLVTFSCDAYPNTTYFGEVAQTLLKMMGHSSHVSGALVALVSEFIWVLVPALIVSTFGALIRRTYVKK
jgi:hypothetical protein